MSTIRFWDGMAIVSICTSVTAYRIVGDMLFLPGRAGSAAEALRHADPLLQSTVNLPGVTPVDRTLVLVVGDCQSCQLKSLDTRKMRLAPDIRLITVLRPGTEIAPSLRKLSSVVVTDHGSAIERSLNAAWLPRAYMVDGSSRLTWIQPTPNTWPAGVSFAQ